jgi:hypothetical protein
MRRIFPASTLAWMVFSAIFGSGIAADDNSVCRIERRHFEVPIRMLPEAVVKWKEFQMYVSSDRGKTWEKFASVEAAASVNVPFTAPCDGIYWFAILLVAKDGTTDPPDLKGLSAGQKVQVALNKAYGEWELPPEKKKGDNITRQISLYLKQSDSGLLITELKADVGGSLLYFESFNFELSREAGSLVIIAEGGPFKKRTVLPYTIEGNRLQIKDGTATTMKGEIPLQGEWTRAGGDK